MGLKQVVGVDGIEHPLTEKQQAELEAAGGKWVQTECKTEEEVVRGVREADGVLFSNAPMTARVLQQLPKCKFAIRYGIGLDNIDLEAAAEQGIIVANVPGFCAEEVSDHALALMLCLARKIKQSDRLMQTGDWSREETRRLWNAPAVEPLHGLRTQTLGIVGFGGIGKGLARKAAPLVGTILIHDPAVDEATVKAAGCVPAGFQQLLERSDYVSLHCPLNDQTYHLMGEGELKWMKKTAYVINTARGPVMDENALVKALEQGWIQGAGMDVFETEPVNPDCSLLKMDNVVLTPHTASYSVDAFLILRQTVVDEAVRILKGQWPKSVCNPAVKERINIATLWTGR